MMVVAVLGGAVLITGVLVWIDKRSGGDRDWGM